MVEIVLVQMLVEAIVVVMLAGMVLVFILVAQFGKPEA